MFSEDKLKNVIFNKLKMIESDNVILEDDMSLEEQLGFDSIQIVEIVVEVEDLFNIQMDYDHLIDAMSSYGSFKKYVESLCD